MEAGGDRGRHGVQLPVVHRPSTSAVTGQPEGHLITIYRNCIRENQLYVARAARL
jgi:hypothetical protein